MRRVFLRHVRLLSRSIEDGPSDIHGYMKGNQDCEVALIIVYHEDKYAKRKMRRLGVEQLCASKKQVTDMQQGMRNP